MAYFIVLIILNEFSKYVSKDRVKNPLLRFKQSPVSPFTNEWDNIRSVKQITFKRK